MALALLCESLLAIIPQTGNIPPLAGVRALFAQDIAYTVQYSPACGG